jgi:hypothetical protein
VKKSGSFKPCNSIKIVCILGAVAILSGCSVSPGTKGTVIGPDANPIADAFVLYGFKGQSVQGFWGSPFPAGIKRTNAAGEFNIPAKIHFFPMFSKGPFRHYVYAIYSPKLHSVSNTPFADSRPIVRLESNANNLSQRWKSIDQLGLAIKQFYGVQPPGIYSSKHWQDCLDSFRNEINEYRNIDKSPPTRILEYVELLDEISKYSGDK